MYKHTLLEEWGDEYARDHTNFAREGVSGH